jgi:hypothetical protein
MSDSSSYVVVRAEKAQQLAQQTLEWIRQARIRDQGRFIREEVESRNRPTWWKKLFGFTPTNAAEVALEFETQPGDWDNEYWMIGHIRYGEMERLAKNVLLAAQTGEPIHLTLEDLKTLS